MGPSQAFPRTTLPPRPSLQAPPRPRRGRLVRAGAALLLAAASAGAAVAATETMPFSEVRPGMKGYGRSVFQGTRVDSFDVEIIGKISNVAPKRNVILARLSGGPLAETGVLEGMSGSPVYLDGKLAGAVAYSWGFSKEPICGITPIDEMLEILSREPPQDRAAVGLRREKPESLARLGEPKTLDAFFLRSLRSLTVAPAPAGLAPIRTPLLIGGGSQRGAAGSALDAFERTFSSLGMSPVRAAGSGSAEGPAGAIEPGSSIAVQLVRGDVEVSGIGTVTYVRGERLLAFGHPMLMLGPTALPLTNTVVHGLLPSAASSFKLASSTTALGEVTQDRFPGVAGRTGAEPPVVPVSVNLRSDEGISKRFAYEIAEDSLLTPVFLYLTLLQILATAEKEVGEITLGIEKGSSIRLEGGLDVQIENLYSGEQSELIASGTVAYMTYLLMNNPDRPSRVERIDLDLQYSDTLSLARIDRIWCERYAVAPGETLPLYVVVSPFRGESFTEMIPLEIPEEAPEGKAILQVGDAVTLSRMEFEAERSSFEPTSLEQLIFLLNRIRTNNRIYATLIRPDTGAIVAGHRLPNLPPSLSTILLSPQIEEAGAVPMRIRGLLEAERDTPYALRGYQKAVLEIKR